MIKALQKRGWREAQLADLVFFQRGFDITQSQQREGTYPVISSSGITSYHDEFKVSGPGIVIGRKGTLGSIHFTDGDYWPHDTTLWSKDLKGNVPKFIYYFLHTLDFKRFDVGNSNPTLNRNHIHDLPIIIPTPSIQYDVVKVISAYDDLIENNRRRMALLEESARLLYREWFVHLRFPGYEHTLIVNGVPEGWKKGYIGDFVESGLVDIQTGPFGTSLKASDYTEEGTPVINVRNIGYGDLRPDKLEYVPEEITDRLSVHLLREGDIVFGRKGAVDRHVLISSSQNGWMQGSDCIRLRSLSDEVCPVLLTFAFREPSHHEWMLTQCGNKATMASLNQGVISRIPAIVPSKIIQDKFRSFATECLDQMTNLALQNQKLRTARDLLLPKLMSGEIEV